jgi:hypothetical protein
MKILKKEIPGHSWHFFFWQKLKTQLCNPLINCTWWTWNLNEKSEIPSSFTSNHDEE